MRDLFGARALLSAGVLSLLACLRSQGAPLVVGGALLTPAEPDPTGGVVVGGGVPVPFASAPGPGQFSGTLTTTVIRDDPSNPFAGIGDPDPANHGLTFVFQIHNDATSLTPIGRLTNIDYSGFLTEVSYQPGAGLLPSTSTDRSAAPGTTVGWSFTGAPLGLGRIAPGQTSALLVIQTNAPGFEDIPANIIDGQVLQAISSGPTPSEIVPEPGIAGLLILGGLTLHRRRSRSAI